MFRIDDQKFIELLTLSVSTKSSLSDYYNNLYLKGAVQCQKIGITGDEFIKDPSRHQKLIG